MILQSTNRRARRIGALVWIAAAVLFCLGGQLQAGGAKNVILMIADGAGFNAFAAASYYEYGSLGKQPYDEFAVKLACTTYPIGADGRATGYDPVSRWSDFEWAKKKGSYTDSAAAATALYTGVKTRPGAISVDPHGQPLTTIGQIAKATGRSVGVVTTVTLSDATPAALAAHNVSRKNYVQIAREMIYGGVLDVIMGCGSPDYDALGNALGQGNKNGYQFVAGERTWQALKSGTAAVRVGDAVERWTLIESKEAFESLARGRVLPKRLIGVPRTHKTLQYGAGNKAGEPYTPPMNPYVPTLETMTRGAINVLAQNDNGFLLMVEGGAVDCANHDNNLGRMIQEQIEFNRAVAAVIEWVEKHGGWAETLVIVTSDHECGCLWGPQSGQAEGFGGFVWDPIENRGAGQIPGHRYYSGGHTNALVPLYAQGAGAKVFEELIDGTDPIRGPYVDNTDVFIVMCRALGASAGRATTGRLWIPRRSRRGRLRRVVPAR